MSSEQIGEWAAKYCDSQDLYQDDGEALRDARHNQSLSQGTVVEVGVTDVPGRKGYVAWFYHQDGSLSLKTKNGGIIPVPLD